MFADYEESFGLFSESFTALEQAFVTVQKNELPVLIRIYISRIYKYKGLTNTRQAYQKALEILDNDVLVPIGMEFAVVEKRIGEIDRSRNIYRFLAQFTEPNIDEFLLWKVWEEFEIEFGNEDTYKELIRMRKFTQQKFNNLPPSLKRVQQKIELEAKTNVAPITNMEVEAEEGEDD